MDFYKELLESFSRVKGRKLRLLEETKETESQFQARVTRANDRFSKMVQSGKFEGFSYKPKGGKVSKAYGKAIFKDGKLTPDTDQKAFKNLITQLAARPQQPGVRGSGQLSTRSEGVPRPSVVDKYPISDEAKVRVKELFNEIAGMGQKIYDEFLKNSTEKEKKELGTFAETKSRYANYLTGESKQSFERKLLAPKSSLILDGDTWVTQGYALDETQLEGITESYRDLLGLITSDLKPGSVQCDSGPTAAKLRKFSKTSDGSVIIRPRAGLRSQALSFADDTGHLKHLLQLAVEKCPKLEVLEEEIKAPLAGGSANDIRGVGFEKLLEIVSLISLNNGGINRGKNPKLLQSELDKLILRKLKKLHGDLIKLKMTVEQWVASSKFSAIDPEDLTIAQNLIKVLKKDMPKGEEGSVGGESEPLFKKMIEHSREAMRVRKPILFLPVGGEVRSGQRQDILEIYKDTKAAEAAMKASGIKNVKPNCDAVETFFKSEKDKKTLEVLIGARKFTKNQEVCTIKVSLKNYMSLNSAKYGGGRYSTFHELMKSKVDTPEYKFLESIAINLGMKPKKEGYAPQGLRALKTYSDEMHSLGAEVFRPEKEGGLKFVTKTTTIGKKKIKVPSGEIIAKALIDTLRKDHSYDELTGSSNAVRTILNKEASGKNLSDKEKTTLKNLRNAEIMGPEGKMIIDDHDIDALVAGATDIVDKAKGSGRKSAELGFERLKYLLNDRLQAMKLRQDIRAGGKQALLAKRFIAAKMFHAGGSDDNNLVCDYRDLTENKTYIFKQNDPLRDAWESVRTGKRGWKMDITTAGMVTLSRTPGKGKPEMKIMLKIEVKSIKDSEGSITGYSQTYIAEVNRGVLEHYSKNEDPEVKNPAIRSSTTLNKAMDKLHELFGILKDKIGVMDL